MSAYTHDFELDGARYRVVVTPPADGLGVTLVPLPKAGRELGAVPQIHDNCSYYIVGDAGDIEVRTSGSFRAIDCQRRRVGNMYATYEDAAAALRRFALVERAMRVRAELWDEGGAPGEWADYHIVPRTAGGSITTNLYGAVTPWTFGTVDAAERFIAAMGDDLHELLTLARATGAGEVEG